MIRMGDASVAFNDSFRFFITTKLPNPHYPPEVSVKVSLVNFTITPSGLQDQMLGTFVVTELPSLEQRKNSLMMATARMKQQLKDIENTILHMLSNSKGNILDDKVLGILVHGSRSPPRLLTPCSALCCSPGTD